MKIRFSLCVFLLFSILAFAQGTFENKKTDAIGELTAGCANSLIAPSLIGFMERAKSAGKPFANEESARKALEQKQVEMQKSEFYKDQLKPAAMATCKCILEYTIAKIQSSKSQTDIESIIKGLKHEPQKSQQCSEKHLASVFRKMK